MLQQFSLLKLEKSTNLERIDQVKASQFISVVALFGCNRYFI